LYGCANLIRSKKVGEHTLGMAVIGFILDAIYYFYKYSRDRYDPEEWMFSGSDLVDGTVEGALKAGMEAYP